MRPQNFHRSGPWTEKARTALEQVLAELRAADECFEKDKLDEERKSVASIVGSVESLLAGVKRRIYGG